MSMEEALAGDDQEAWLASREDEFQSHMENETWTLTNLPPGRKALDCTWVLRVKTDAEGRLERHKTRLVIKGFQQREGIDFQEVFAPVAKAPTLWLLLAAAAVCGWKVEQMDVKTAFLYGVVDEEIYMKQPEGYDDGSGRVCRLKKAIYGLKQAPRCWYARLVEVLEALGFKVSGCDESLFMTKGEEEKVFLLVYVDDILLFSPSLERIKKVQGKLKETIQCKALGPVGYYLGLHMERDEVKGWLRLHQHKYLAAMGEKYVLEEGRSVMTPLPSGFQLHLDEEEGEVLEYELQRRFQSMVLLVALHARPSLRGAPPPPLPAPMPLLLLLTSLVLRKSGLLLLVRSAAAARARVAGVVAVAAGVVVGAAVEVVEAVEVVAVVGDVAGVGALVEAVVAAVGVAVVAVVAVVTAVGVVALGLELLNLEVVAVAKGSCSSVGARPRRPSSFTCGMPQTQHHCFSGLDFAWRAEFGDDAKRSRWAELLRSGVAIFDLDYDAILAAIESALPGTAPDEALHTFTLESGASRCFFRNSTTLTPLFALVPAILADPSGGPVLAHSSTILPCQVAPPCSCRLLSHQTLLWHHRLGHSSLPRLRGMHSRLLVSGLPRSLPPLPPLPAPPCLPCVEGRQCADPHSSSFPLTTAPLQTLHTDVWGLTHASGQDRERYFLLVVNCSTRYTTVFPLCSKSEVFDVLIPWIRAVGLQLREWFRQDLPVLRLHSDKGVEFSCDFLQDFCRREGILQPFTLPDSPQQNGIVESCIGLVIEVARTSMIHAAAPHFLWLFAGLPPSGVSQVDPHCSTVPVEVAVGSSGTGSGGAEPGDAESGGAEPAGVESGGAEPEGVEPRGAESGGAEPRGTASSGGPVGASPRLSPRPEPLSLQQLRKWFTLRTRLHSVTTGARDSAAGDTRDGGVGVNTVAGGTRGAAAAGPGGARTWGTRAARSGTVGGAGAGDSTEPGAARTGGTGTGGTGAGGAGGVDPGAGVAGAGGVACGGTGAGGTLRPRPYFVPLLQQVLASLPTTCSSCGREQTGGLTERREPASRPASPDHTGRRVPCLRPPPVPHTHAMALRQTSVQLCAPLPPSSESSLLAVPDPESDRTRAASPTVSHLLATVVTDPSFESTAASALVDQLVEFAAACRLDYATALVAKSESASPPCVGGECALGTDVLEDMQEDFECLAVAVPRFASMLLAPEGDPYAPDILTPRSYAEAITGPYSSQWQAAMDAKMASWKSTSTYVDAVPLSCANIVDGMWILRVQWPCVQTFSPIPKMTTLWELLHVASQHDYELHSLDFGTAFLQGSLLEEMWLRPPPGFTRSFPAGTQCCLRWPVYGLRQAPCEWHDTLRTTLAVLRFTPSTSDLSLFLRTDTSQSPFYVLVYVDNLVFATANTDALTLVKLELQKKHTCTDLGELRSYLGLQITLDRVHHHPHSVTHGAPRPSALLLPVLLATAHSSVYQPLALSSTFGRVRRAEWSIPTACVLPHVHWDAAKRVLHYLCSTSGMGLVLGGRGPVFLTGHADASWVDDSATQRSSQGDTFSLSSGSVSWRSIRSSLVLSSSCEAENYFGAMAAQELRWLTYLLTD
ncbi:unnamed protein product [Closterium sp. NIES-54]